MTISNITLTPGRCGQTGGSPDGSDRVAFVLEPFSATIEVNLPTAGAGRRLLVGIGTDSRGTQGRRIDIPASASGVVRYCVDGFMLDWPGPAQVIVELYEGDVWQSRRYAALRVVPRGRVHPVFFPRHTHPTQRSGSSVRVGGNLRLEVGVYGVNGTGQARRLQANVSGLLHGGSSGGKTSFGARLSTAPLVPAYGVSEIQTFHVDVPLNTPLGQVIFRDKVVMLPNLGGGIGGSPRANRVLDWRTLRGVAADLVFVGDFTAAQRSALFQAVVREAAGYLQRAGMTLNRALSRFHTGEQLGMSAADVARLRVIDDREEADQLAQFQPSKKIPRVTIYVVEGLFGRGWVGGHVGGGIRAVDPRTPWRSPIVKFLRNDVVLRPLDPLDDLLRHFTDGRQAFGAVVAHELGHALGGLGHTEKMFCTDTDPQAPDDRFNLMSRYGTGYSWYLSPCQRRHIAPKPEYYSY